MKSGDRIEDKVHEGLSGCNELISLLIPWSVGRNWVWSEMAAAWILRKHYVGILYGVTLEDIDWNRGGLAILLSTNVIGINDTENYLEEVSVGSREANDG